MEWDWKFQSIPFYREWLQNERQGEQKKKKTPLVNLLFLMTVVGFFFALLADYYESFSTCFYMYVCVCLCFGKADNLHWERLLFLAPFLLTHFHELDSRGSFKCQIKTCENDGSVHPGPDLNLNWIRLDRIGSVLISKKLEFEPWISWKSLLANCIDRKGTIFIFSFFFLFFFLFFFFWREDAS